MYKKSSSRGGKLYNGGGKKMKVGEIRIKAVQGDYEELPPKPFGRHKFTIVDGYKIDLLGRLVGATFFYEIKEKDGSVRSFTNVVKY